MRNPFAIRSFRSGQTPLPNFSIHKLRSHKLPSEDSPTENQNYTFHKNIHTSKSQKETNQGSRFSLNLQSLTNSLHNLTKWNLTKRSLSSSSPNDLESPRSNHINGMNNLNTYKLNKFNFSSAFPIPHQNGRLGTDNIPDYLELMDQQITSQLLEPFQQAKNRTLLAIVFEQNGKKTEKVMTRTEILQEVKINARDLKTVDDTILTQQYPSLLVRENGILVNLLHIKAIIQGKRVIIFNSHDPNLKSFVSLLEQMLQVQNNLANKNVVDVTEENQPFEFIVLEAIFIDVCTRLAAQFERLQPAILDHLDKMANNVHDLKQNQLVLSLRKSLNQSAKTVETIRNAIQEVWQSDEDMAAMYLTSKEVTGKKRKVDEHTEVEILLETYIRQIELVHNEIAELQQAISSTDEFLQMQLDSARNQVMRLNMMLHLGTFSLTFSSLGAAIYGMNLPSGFEHHPYAFYLVGGTLALWSGTIFTVMRHYIKRRRII